MQGVTRSKTETDGVAGEDAQAARPTFSIVATCKDRLEHLKIALTGFMAQSDAEIVVVDYSCPQHAGAYVREACPDACVVEVPDRPHFNLADARNMGAASARGDILLFCDADTLLADNVTARLAGLLEPSSFICFGGKDNSLRGICAVPREAFDLVEGYDDVIEGYGGEDLDFYFRLQLAGYTSISIDAEGFASSQPHGNELRTAHYRIKNIKLSFLVSRAYRLCKELTLQIQRRPELPRARREALWKLARQTIAAAQREGFRNGIEIRIPVPGLTTSGFLHEWEWSRELVVKMKLKPNPRPRDAPL